MLCLRTCPGQVQQHIVLISKMQLYLLLNTGQYGVFVLAIHPVFRKAVGYAGQHGEVLAF